MRIVISNKLMVLIARIKGFGEIGGHYTYSKVKEIPL